MVFDDVAEELAAHVREHCACPYAIVAIDGPGGAGKSTLARRLASVLDDATIVATDDFTAWNDPIDWWHRMLEEVIEPLSVGRAARYRRRNFLTGELLDWVAVPEAGVTIIEGVSSSRREWADRLCFSVWVETPRDERLRRGLERDGTDALSAWNGWMAVEDEFFARDKPWERATAIVPGTATAK